MHKGCKTKCELRSRNVRKAEYVQLGRITPIQRYKMKRRETQFSVSP